MTEGKRSFFATVPGLVTGLAGLLTAVVGLVTVLIQLGVIGEDSDSPSGGTTTTVLPGAASGPSTTEVPRFVVTPTLLDFPTGGAKTKTVTVKNDSNSVVLNVQSPELTGPGKAQFSVSSGSCTSPVGPGRTCELSVTFAPSGPLGNYQAALQVAAQGTRPQEVRITASSLLG